ncbi:ABC transporter permease [Rossellomorea arthrocnemi]|jgi:putative ABC transport system permease protein|uniref:ABC transporter permease n=1 Tax=Rossellomorea arthrocnemi TaxID=2769542 RepID=UPI0019188E87|nr:ABC transporter permease [Rossellomorea arthrocnemi]
MNFIKRAFWSVKARTGKSILLLIVLSVISVLVLSGLTIQTAADQSSILAREKLGGEVTLSVDREKQMARQQSQTQDGERPRFQSVPVPLEAAKGLTGSNDLKGYNYYSTTSALAKDFTAVGSDDTTKSNEQGGFGGGGRMMAGDVSVEGIVFSDSTSSFLNGDASIVEGRHLNEEDLNKEVTLVEKNLAAENDLKVGDSITISNTDNIESTLEIVGIYESTAEMDERAQNFAFLNPSNQLFVPYTIANTLKGTTDTIDRAVYYMKDPADIQAFIEDAEKSSSIDFDQFKLDANDQLYQQMMGPIDNVASFSNNVVLLVTIAGAIILVLIVMMTIRERKYEMGVLLAIGEKKGKLVSQFLVEILIVAVLAMGISTLSGNLVANQLGEQLLQQEITQSEEAVDTPASLNSRRMPMPFQSPSVQDVDTMNELSIHTTGEDLMKLFGIGMIVVLFSTLIPSLTVLRLNPKAILTKQD